MIRRHATHGDWTVGGDASSSRAELNLLLQRARVDRQLSQAGAGGREDGVRHRRHDGRRPGTHGHGDHFFGLGALLERFPTARGVATPGVISVMRERLEPAWLDNFWRPRFPGQIAEKLVRAEPLQCD